MSGQFISRLAALNWYPWVSNLWNGAHHITLHCFSWQKENLISRNYWKRKGEFQPYKAISKSLPGVLSHLSIIPYCGCVSNGSLCFVWQNCGAGCGESLDDDGSVVIHAKKRIRDLPEKVQEQITHSFLVTCLVSVPAFPTIPWESAWWILASEHPCNSILLLVMSMSNQRPAIT